MKKSNGLKKKLILALGLILVAGALVIGGIALANANGGDGDGGQGSVDLPLVDFSDLFG